MKRWTLRILLCLILGAVSTVAVAWGVSALPVRPITIVHDYVDHAERPEIFFSVSRTWGSTSIQVWRFPEKSRLERQPAFMGWPPAWTELHAIDDLPQLPSGAMMPLNFRGEAFWQEKAFGFPCLAIAWIQMWDDQIQRDCFRNGIVLEEGRGIMDWRILPLRPIWPGFVIDTPFYAAIWGAIFFGFASAKRAIRRRRGRCPRCGYDLRGGVMSDKRLAMSGETATSTAGCPECGWNREESAA